MSKNSNRASRNRDTREQAQSAWKEKQQNGKLNNFKPTVNQNKIVDSINNNTLTVVTGGAGVGKTSVILHSFCKEYLHNQSVSIYVIRQPNEAGNLDRLGFLKGDLNEKLLPHFKAYEVILTDFLGPKFKADFEKRIQFEPINYMLGRTLDNALILIDEGQTVEPMLMKLMLERVGENSKVVIAGDISQCYTNGKRGGLQDVIQRFFKEDGTPEINSAGLVQLTSEDVMRSEFCKSVVKRYEEKPLQ